MKKDNLKDTIKKQYEAEGHSMYKTNADLIIDGINNGSDNVVPVNVSAIERGKFYFMFYDLSGKSSRMEKFNPLFIIDWNDADGTRYMYGISMNFIPVSIRTVFFNSMCNYNSDTMDKNSSLQTEKQIAFENIDFANIYKLLYAIGFEWSIRKFDCKLLNKVYAISTSMLPTLVTMSTAQLTGVDDGKLIEIWQKKIQEQEARHDRMIKELVGDYKKMENELSVAYDTLDTRNNNLDKSLKLIKTLF